MRKYWSCSAFADWIRGTKKPSALAWDDWDRWHSEASNAHPVRYWIAEKMLDRVNAVITGPVKLLKNVRTYFRNRFVDKIHALTADNHSLVRGAYYDLDYRMFRCIFDEFVRFIEIEVASLSVVNETLPLKYKIPIIREFCQYRSTEQGLQWLVSMSESVFTEDYFVSNSNPLLNTPLPSAGVYRKLLEAYVWYTAKFPHLQDPGNLSGLDDHIEKYGLNWNGTLSKELTEERATLYKKRDDIEKEQFDTITKYLTTIIEYRSYLWT